MKPNNTHDGEIGRLTLVSMLALVVHAAAISGIRFMIFPDLSDPSQSYYSLSVSLLDQAGGEPRSSKSNDLSEELLAPEEATLPELAPPQSELTPVPSEQASLQPTPPTPPSSKLPAAPITSKAPNLVTTVTTNVPRTIPSIRELAGPSPPETSKAPPKSPHPPPSLPKAIDLMTSGLQIARINPISRPQASSAREKHYNPKSMTTLEKFYIQAWIRKVEQVGTLNFPEEARRRKLTGSLTLDVALRTDGTVRNITLVRSSGHKVLDDAAFHIVELAAPYAPFPVELRRQYDILHIKRTWQFLQGNRLLGR